VTTTELRNPRSVELELLSRDDLAAIWAQSLTLYERLDSGLAYSPNDTEGLELLLTRWRDICAKGSNDEFLRRLSEDGLTLEEVKRVIGTPRPVSQPDEQLPPWCEFLHEALLGTHSWNDADIFEPGVHDRALPFYPLIAPFARLAVRRLRNSVEFSCVTDGAVDGLIRKLHARLAYLSVKTHHLEFVIFRSTRESSLAPVLRRALGESSDVFYREFVRSFYDGEWRRFLLEYAVLARQLAVISMDWADAMTDILCRLHADRDSLCAEFSVGQDPGKVVEIESEVSDFHRQGRASAVLSFESGLKVVYKPKSLDTDLLFNRLIDWTNQQPGILPLSAVPTLHREDYGWQLFVSHQACSDKDEAHGFYQRMGQLLGLVYALEGYDCHHENLVAAGETPYLIDTETIFNPYKEMDSASGDQLDAARLASKTLYYSVVRTGLLPTWSLGDDGSKRDISGLGGAGEQHNDPFRVTTWISGNSDDIRIERTAATIMQHGNQPAEPSGETIHAEGFVDDIRAGFSAFYRALLANRDSFLHEIESWPPVQVRFVRKPTQLYADTLRRLMEPKALRDGMNWSIEVDYQSRMFLAAKTDHSGVWNLLREEFNSLIRGDIPHFRVPTDSLDIHGAEGSTIVSGYFTTDCKVRLTEKIRALSDNDLALQDRYITYSFYARAARTIHDEPDALAYLNDPIKTSNDLLLPAEPAECIEVATKIGEELIREALLADDGSISWIALEYMQDAGIFQFQPVSYNLYSGTAGIACFLAALGRVSGRPEFSDAAWDATRPLFRMAEEGHESIIHLSGLGVGVGLGSLIYGFAYLADMFGPGERRDMCLETATRCAEQIDERALQADHRHDVMFGSAGAILALYRLELVGAGTSVADRVSALAQHLMDARIVTDSGHNIVPTLRSAAATGFSHGTAGTALALARAGALTSTQLYVDAALEHVEFEELLYDPKKKNYPDYRSEPGRPSFITAWCHGSPGIGLARLRLYQLTGEARLRDQAERAMATTGGFTLDHLDHICCGNLGRIDIQLEFAREMQDETLKMSVRRDAAYVLNRYHEKGGFRMFMNTPTQVFSPGLFVGAAGAGMTLLRLADESLPCIMAFD
jgi:type 2 lantibiotic biosynthesis protein LanM